MSWINKKVTQFHERRRKDPRKDMEFLNLQRREKHICYTNSQLNGFLEEHLREAEIHHHRQEQYLLVLDVESHPNPKFSWHEAELKEKKTSGEELTARWQQREALRGRAEWTKPHLKVLRYWANREEERNSAISMGSAAAFSIAAVNDKHGNRTFAAHCSNIISNSIAKY